jgi:hypothetical protein
MFLLLCLPQLRIGRSEGVRAQGRDDCRARPFRYRLGVLWVNGYANGHSMFLLLPQLFDWLLFFLSGCGADFKFFAHVGLLDLTSGSRLDQLPSRGRVDQPF